LGRSIGSRSPLFRNCRTLTGTLNNDPQYEKSFYFIAGPVPTEAERDDAEQFYNGKSTVAFRNARFVNKDEAIEAFDIVAGLVPANYAAAALEKGEDALQAVPVVDAATVPAGSPLAGKGDGKPGASA
jgi:hypothetical protein